MQLLPPLSSTAQALFPELEGLGQVSDRAVAAAITLYGGLLLVGLCVLIGLVVHLYRTSSTWSSGVIRLRSRPVGWRDMLFLFCALVVGILLADGLVRALQSFGPFATESSWGRLVVHSACFHWLAVACVGYLVARKPSSWRDVFGSAKAKRSVLVVGLLTYLAILPVVFFYSLIYQVLLSVWGYESTVQDIALYLTQEHPLVVQCYFVFLAVVVAPVAEEFIFRGLALPLMARVTSAPMAAVIVSLGFAALHYHIPSLLPLFILSLGFCCAYIYTGSLVVPMVMHAAFNGVSLGLLMILRYL